MQREEVIVNPRHNRGKRVNFPFDLSAQLTMHGEETELQIALLQPGKVVWLVQILLLLNLGLRNTIFEATTNYRLHFCLRAILHAIKIV